MAEVSEQKPDVVVDDAAAAAAAAVDNNAAAGGAVDGVAGGDGGGDEKKPVAVDGGAVTNRVYVGNLPWTVSWQDLKDHMRAAGNVVYSDVFTDDSGRSKGCGIVEFDTREAALKAIAELSDSRIGETERPIFIREDREDKNAPNRGAGRGGRGGRGGARGGAGGFRGGARGGRGGARGGGVANYTPSATPVDPSMHGCQVFVGNLPYTTSWQDLKDHFRTAGTVVRADVLTDHSGRSKGSGTVLFETPEDAAAAIAQFNETEIAGRAITVRVYKFV